MGVIVAVAVVALSVGAALGWLLAGRDADEHAGHAERAEPVEAAAATAPAGQQMYTCSMHPQVRSPNPDDKCPICGMDLIPVPGDEEAEDDGELPRLRLTARAAALMQVQVQPARRRDVPVPVRFYGRLDYDETRLRDVNLKVSGWIEKLHVDYVGAPVRQGQPLFELYAPQLYAAQEEYLLARRHRDSGGAEAADLLDAARTRLRYFDITDEQIAELEARGEPARTMTVLSPFDGVVIERGAYEGLKVDPGTRIYRLADLSQLWVQLEAYEADLPWLAPGQPASFTTRAQPGETMTGTVTFIAPTINERTRTARVRVETPNPDGRLKPGMYVTGQIEGVLPDAPLVVPASAPLLTGRRAVVYVQLADADRPTFEPRNVTLGPRAGDWYVVREGLAEGELVVTHGAFKIDSELQIRGRPSMMQPGGGSPPTHEHGAAEPGGHDGAASRAESEVTAASQQDIDAYPLNRCVISGMPLDSMGGPIRVIHDGHVVLLCCEGCLDKFRADPEGYLAERDRLRGDDR